MRYLTAIAILLLTCYPAAAEQNQAEVLVDGALHSCASSSGEPINVDGIEKSFGDKFSVIAPICNLYLQAWYKGYRFPLTVETDPAQISFCKREIEALAEGSDAQTYQAHLTSNYSNANQRAAVASLCETYRSAFTAGVTYARSLAVH